MELLEEFMKGRPHDKDKNVTESVMEYIKLIEDKSIERYDLLNK